MAFNCFTLYSRIYMKHIAEHEPRAIGAHTSGTIRDPPRVTSRAIFPPTYGAPVFIFRLFPARGHPSSLAITRYKERPSPIACRSETVLQAAPPAPYHLSILASGVRRCWTLMPVTSGALALCSTVIVKNERTKNRNGSEDREPPTVRCSLKSGPFSLT